MMKLVVKFGHCNLQIRILVLCGFYLFCQCCVCRLQLSYLLFEVVDLQSLDLLQIKKIEGIICRSGQLCFSHTSFKAGCFQHALMSNSPGSSAWWWIGRYETGETSKSAACLSHNSVRAASA